ncbi:MAG: translocation/assembly module TamB [Deltaproteobacteria bacterium]|jgi:translocation and assembly module TamB|nr:translocation/assembly module TamB [Deltaproteobacteria bacterium]
MVTLSKRAKPAKPSHRKRRFLFRGLIALVALSALAIGGAFLFLRSESGLLFVQKKIQEGLAEAGLSMEAGAVEGPLPGLLAFKDLRLADSKGVFFRADELRVALNVWALLGKTVEARDLTLVGGDLIRPPITAAAAPEEKKPFAFPDFKFKAKISVADARLFSSQDPLLAQSPLNLEADLFLDPRARSLAGDFALSWRGPKARGLDFSLNLSQDSANLLTVALVLDAGADSPLSLFASSLPWESPVLTLQGTGPASAWKGTLAMTGSAPGSEADPTIPSPGLRGDLELRGEDGRRLAELLFEPNLPLSLNLSLVKDPAFPLPGTLEENVGKALALQVAASKKDGEIAGTLSLASEKGALRFSEVRAAFRGEETLASLAGSLTLAPASSDPAAAAPPAGEGASPTPSAPEVSPAPLPPPAPLASPPPLTAQLRLAVASRAAEFEIEGFALNGEGLSLSLQGALERGEKESARANLDFALQEDSPFWGFISPLAPFLKEKSAVALHLRGTGELAAPRALDASLTLAVGEVGAFAEDRVRGGIESRIEAKGELDGLLAVSAEFGADSLSLLAQPGDAAPLLFRAPKLTVAGENLRLFPLSDINAKLSLEAQGPFGESVPENPQSPAETRLEGDFYFARDGEAISVGARELSLSSLNARLGSPAASASFGAEGPPTLRGALSLSVGDWELISKLAGIEIEGSPLELSLFAPPDATAPEINAALSCAFLSVGPNLRLGNANLSARLVNPFEPARALYFVKLGLGPGRVGETPWASGSVSVENPQEGGPVTVQANWAKPQGGDLLALEGVWRGPGALVYLSKLAFAPPFLPRPLVLAKPVSLIASGPDFDSASLKLDELSLALGDATFVLAGSLRPLDARASLKNLQFADLKGLLGDKTPLGDLSLDLAYGETGQGAYSLSANVAPTGDRGQRLVFGLRSAGSLSGGVLLKGDVDATLPGRERDNPIKISYEIPFRKAGAFPRPNLAGPLRASAHWTGEAQSVFSFLGLADRRVSGALELDAQVGGSLANPIPRVSLYLANGSYEDQILGLSLSDANVEVEAAEGLREIRLLAEAADKGDGTIQLEGSLNLASEPPRLSIRGQLKHLSPFHRDDLTVMASGLASLEGPLSSPAISAKLLVEYAEISLNQFGGPSVQTLEIANELVRTSLGLPLNVEAEIPRAAYIRGRGLDSEWKGQFRVGGSTGALDLVGSLSPTRGFFTLLGKEFTFSGGEIAFRGGSRLNPGLDITLTRDVPDLTAYLKVQGSLSRPKISFESSPPYPSDEVLSQILFGKKASQLSRFEAIQLANSLREMSGVGGNVPNPLVTMRDALGLSVLKMGESSGGSERRLAENSFRDDLDLDDDESSSDEGGSTIEAGKYLSDNIYVGVEQDLARDETGVRVEVELAPNVNLVSRSTASSNRVALGWKRDY